MNSSILEILFLKSEYSNSMGFINLKGLNRIFSQKLLKSENSFSLLLLKNFKISIISEFLIYNFFLQKGHT